MNILLADLTKQSFDCLVNAANGIGPMGAGIAGALKRAGGDVVQASAQEACRNHTHQMHGETLMGYAAGSAYMSDPGRLRDQGVKAIVHAVTMYEPTGYTNVAICRQALVQAITLAVKNNYKSIGIPALGTGVGGLDKREIADMMVTTLMHFDNLLDINIMDIDEEFVNACRLAKQGV